DGIMYNPVAKRVYVCDGKTKSATLIDPKRQSVVGTIFLGGKPETPHYDPKTGLMYQQLEDTSELVIVDVTKRAVLARYPVAPGEEATALAFDVAHHRLFIGCGNAQLVVMDAANGKVIQTLPIGKGVDFAAYDPKLGRIYTANGKSATMTVIRQESPDR